MDTPLTSLFIDGMDEGQIWEQLDLRARNICNMLQHALEGGPDNDGNDDDDTDGDGSDEEDEGAMLRKALQALGYDDVDLDSMDLDGAEDEDDVSLDNEGSFLSVSDEDDMDEPEGSDGVDLGESVTTLRESSSEDENEGEDDEFLLESTSGKRRSGTTKHRRSVLDDRFFDLTSFNTETEAAEAKTHSNGSLGRRLADEDSEDSEGNDDVSVDMFAPVDNFEQFDEEDLEKDGGGMTPSSF